MSSPKTKPGQPQQAVFFDLVTTRGQRLSPWCWHVRMALAHKQVAVETVLVPFTGKTVIEALDAHTLPVFKDTDGTVLRQSHEIVDHLEATRTGQALYPGGAAGLNFIRFVHRHIQTQLFPSLVPLIIMDIPDLLEGEDRDYFITSREARFGKSLAEVCADREQRREVFTARLEPFRKLLTHTRWISGESPAHADYLLFGTLQWARISSNFSILDTDDPLAEWFSRSLSLFEGLGESEPARKDTV